jgi:diguanylate cyclase (GGDEF)-like protein
MTDEKTLRLLSLRERFIERAWDSSVILGIIFGVAVPARALALRAWHLTDSLILGICCAGLVLYWMRGRLTASARLATPIFTLMLGGTIGTLGNGLQGSGMVALLFGNVLAAMLCSNRVFLATLGVTILTGATAALGYASGVLSLRFDHTYFGSLVGWSYMLVTVAGGTFALMYFVRLYRVELELLNTELINQLRQISTQRDEIARRADHDALTSLPTVRLGRDRLEVACAHARRAHQQVSVLFVDLDAFKAANDRFGHSAGDEVLKTTAARLQSCVRSSDTVARWGGDEFVVVLTDITEPSAPVRVGNEIIRKIKQPIYYRGIPISIGASVGIAVFPDDSPEPATVLRYADQAMYSAKQRGKNRFERYAPPPQLAGTA